jgi:hypothetical protein
VFATQQDVLDNLNKTITLSFNSGSIVISEGVEFTVTPVPGPGALVLLGVGAAIIATSGRKRDAAAPAPANG